MVQEDKLCEQNNVLNIKPATTLVRSKLYVVKLFLVTYLLLTSRNRVLLEKLTGSQLLKKFPATAFTSARQLSLS